MAALIQAVLDDVCAGLPLSELATRERVATRLREAAQTDRRSIEDLNRLREMLWSAHRRCGAKA
ncbi:hypothetical protein WN72_13465 [Bradyrhizobium arachidis]|uniref:Uncharacterized protein n=2 Tax=Bradyrhizobium arachidis TaxID=858423 RepID=A0AAE7TG73_9BRAD|nr:hypothetical protein WN72_13465 [Bradyrhizobium arachidis]